MRAVVVALLLALVACREARRCPAEHCLPAFEARTLEGAALAADDLRGKIVLVNFWATWCKPCVDEMPALRALAERYADRGVVVVGFLSDARASDAEARDFLANLGITYPVARATAEVDRAFRPPPTLPATYLYDARGVRVWGWTRSVDLAEVEAKLRPLIE